MAPGDHFTYFGKRDRIPGEILENATGMNINKVSEKQLYSYLSDLEGFIPAITKVL